MKFLAILKDSLRETLDVWLFYVMVGLSVLTVALVACVSYDPVSADQYLTFNTFQPLVGITSQLHSNEETRGLDVAIDIENFERTDKRTEPWLGDYKFDYVFRFSTRETKNPLDKGKAEQALEKFREKFGELVKPEEIRFLIQSQRFTNVEVKREPSTDPNEIRFAVTTHGTAIKSREEWFHQPRVFGKEIPLPVFTLERLVRFVSDDLIGKWGSSFTLIISIIVTAWFLPNMLGKGTVDMLLVKPISRVTLLLYKFCGGLLFMFLNTVVILTGVWLATGLRTGMWINSLLICIPVYTFQFAILYSVSAVAAVFTRNVIVSILVSLALWTFLITFGWVHWGYVEARRPHPDAEVTTQEENPFNVNGQDSQQAPPPKEDVTKDPVYITMDVMHTVLPRYKDIDWLTSRMLEEEAIRIRPEPEPDPSDKDEHAAWEKRKENAEKIHKQQLKALDRRYGSYDWTSSLVVSSIFIVLMLGLACWRFATKDY